MTEAIQPDLFGETEVPLAALTEDRVIVGHRHPQTSQDAACAALPRSGTHRRQIVEWIGSGGTQATFSATDDEIERHFGWSHQSASACRNGLMNDGWLEDSGMRRRVARSGNKAIAWKVTDRGRSQL